jgi:phosphoglycolate phosphatase
MAVVVLAGLPRVAAADEWDSCVKLSDDLAVAGCSRAIDSHQYTGRSLARLYARRGGAYQTQGDLNHAMADYNESMRIDPTYPAAYNNRGNIWYRKGDFDRAIADYNRAIGHEPNEILDIKRVIGPPLEDVMQFLLQPYGDDRIAEAVLAFRQHYGESGLLGSEPYPGIGNSLREMQQGGLRLYLATSKRDAFARRILEHLELAAYFDGIHGSVPSKELDHKPELLAHILSEHDISPTRSLMVGDRRYDISGAHAVGMRGLGVLWGYGTRDELESAGADQLVESTVDLARTVLAMVGGKQPST